MVGLKEGGTAIQRNSSPLNFEDVNDGRGKQMILHNTHKGPTMSEEPRSWADEVEAEDCLALVVWTEIDDEKL